MEDFIFYLVIAALFCIVIGAGYVWKKGLLGTANEARLKKIRASVAEWAKDELDRLDQAIAAKESKKPPIPIVTESLGRTDSLADAWKLKQEGAITQEEYDKIKKGIMG